MKRKKLFASAVAGMLVAAQMMVPASAADGTLTVNVQTISPVIRVAVPTSLLIAVNEFEKDDAGSQIKSDAFTMLNKSEVPVKVKVTSTQSYNSANSGQATDLAPLVATKKEAEEASAHKTWLAVAAQVAAGKYITETGKGVRDLTETAANVVTFDTANKNATQSFYLAAPGAAVTYKAFKLTQGETLADRKTAIKTADLDLSYAKYYEMEKITAIDGDAAFAAAVAVGDVYMIKKDDLAVTYYAQGSTITGTPYATNNTTHEFYAVKAVVEEGDLTIPSSNSTIYVYGGSANTTTTPAKDSAAGFRYIGKLGQNAAGDAWTAKEVGIITITYDVDGISQARYDSVKGNCEYGYFKSQLGKTTDGKSVTDNAATPTAYTTKATIAARLAKADGKNKVQFMLTSSQLATVKAEGLKVQKVSYKASTADSSEQSIAITDDMVSDNASPAANADGKLYSLTNTTFSGVTAIDYIIVEYAKTADATSVMKVKYTFSN